MIEQMLLIALHFTLSYQPLQLQLQQQIQDMFLLGSQTMLCCHFLDNVCALSDQNWYFKFLFRRYVSQHSCFILRFDNIFSYVFKKEASIDGFPLEISFNVDFRPFEEADFFLVKLKLGYDSIPIDFIKGLQNHGFLGFDVNEQILFGEQLLVLSVLFQVMSDGLGNGCPIFADLAFDNQVPIVPNLKPSLASSHEIVGEWSLPNLLVQVYRDQNDDALRHNHFEGIEIVDNSETSLRLGLRGFVFKALSASEGDIVCCILGSDNVKAMIIEGSDVLRGVGEVVEFSKLICDAQDFLPNQEHRLEEPCQFS